MERSIVGFTADELGEWVASLSCGHRQHVRHRPPFQLRPWVTDEAGRRERLGSPLDCPLCDRAEVSDSPVEEGGEAACMAALICPDCGGVLVDPDHADGCPPARP